MWGAQAPAPAVTREAFKLVVPVTTPAGVASLVFDPFADAEADVEITMRIEGDTIEPTLDGKSIRCAPGSPGCTLDALSRLGEGDTARVVLAIAKGTPFSEIAAAAARAERVLEGQGARVLLVLETLDE